MSLQDARRQQSTLAATTSNALTELAEAMERLAPALRLLSCESDTAHAERLLENLASLVRTTLSLLVTQRAVDAAMAEVES